MINQPGGGTAALRLDKPLEKSVRCAEGGERHGILVDGDLVERGDEVEQERDAPFAQGIEDLVNAGDGESSEGADGVQLLVVDGDVDASILLGGDNHWAGIWSSGMPDEAGGQILVDDGIGFFGQDWVHPAAAGGDGGAVRRDGDLEWYEGARAEVGVGRGEDVPEFA